MGVNPQFNADIAFFPSDQKLKQRYLEEWQCEPRESLRGIFSGESFRGSVECKCI